MNTSSERWTTYSSSAVSITSSPVQSPLHSASVHVTQLSPSPNPIPLEKPQEVINDIVRFGEDYLSPIRLRELSGESDLDKVTYLQLSINSTSSSVGNFGNNLPSLTELRCVDSHVTCVRDLGTGLAGLTVLWLSNSGLKDLDGLPSLSSLQELYISHNSVSDISVTAMMTSLKVLDLECNELYDEDQLGYLSLCVSLSSLTLTGNPIVNTLRRYEEDVAGYRDRVIKAIPQLTILDDISIFSPEATNVSFSSLSLNNSTRPHSAMSLLGGATSSLYDDSSSDLTHGINQVICGNPARALKSRRRGILSSQSAVTLSSPRKRCSSSLDILLEDHSSTTRLSSPPPTTRLPSPPPTTTLSSPPPTTRLSSPPHTTRLSSPPPTTRLPSPPPTSILRLPSPPPALSFHTRPYSADLRHKRYHRPSLTSPSNHQT